MTPRHLCLILPLLACLVAGPLAAQSPSSTLAQARVYEAAKQFDLAAGAYRDYLAARPEDDEVRASLARVLSWQGQYQEAVALYQDILSRHPVDLDVRVALARVKSWQKKFAEAQAGYEAVLKEDPKNQDAKRGLADILYWTGDYTHALRLYEELASANPDPELTQRIAAVKAELAALTPAQARRAPVGLGRRDVSLPFRDYVKAGYAHFTYTSQIPDERDLLVEVAKPFGAQTLVGRFEYLNRFGFQDPQLSGELYSPLWQKAWGYLSASGAVNPDFAANWTLGGEFFQGLGVVQSALSPLEAHFGYRHMDFPSSDVDLLTPGLTIFFPYNFWLTEKVYYVPDTGAATLSSRLTWRPANRWELFASGGFGTSSELINAVLDFINVQTRTVSGGITFPLAERVSGQALGFYEDRETLYVRRGGMFNLIYHF